MISVERNFSTVHCHSWPQLIDKVHDSPFLSCCKAPHYFATHVTTAMNLRKRACGQLELASDSKYAYGSGRENVAEFSQAAVPLALGMWLALTTITMRQPTRVTHCPLLPAQAGDR